MANVTRKGRNRTPPFVMLEHRLIDSPAWVSLGGSAVKLLMLMARRYNGSNNGQMHLGEREAAEVIGLSRNTVASAFAQLEAAGFIVAVERGHFHVKARIATRWRLTFHSTDNGPATHDYRAFPTA